MGSVPLQMTQWSQWAAFYYRWRSEVNGQRSITDDAVCSVTSTALWGPADSEEQSPAEEAIYVRGCQMLPSDNKDTASEIHDTATMKPHTCSQHLILTILAIMIPVIMIPGLGAAIEQPCYHAAMNAWYAVNRRYVRHCALIQIEMRFLSLLRKDWCRILYQTLHLNLQAFIL